MRLNVTVPERRSEWSLDLKLFAILGAALFAGMMLGDGPLLAGVSDAAYYGTYAALALVLFAIAKIHREVRRWHWPGLGESGLHSLCFIALIGGAFLYVFSHGAGSRLGTTGLCFASTLVLFGVLQAANVVQLRAWEFDRLCEDYDGPDEPESPEVYPEEPELLPKSGWMAKAAAIVTGIWGVVAVVACFDFLAFMVFYHVLLDIGLDAPTASHAAILTNHGRTIFITETHRAVLDVLESIMLFTYPVAIGGGLVGATVSAIGKWRRRKSS